MINEVINIEVSGAITNMNKLKQNLDGINRAVNGVEANMKDMGTKGSEAANKLAGSTATAGRAATFAERAFQRLGAVIGAAFLLRALNKAVGTIKDFEQSMADLSAITGATGKDLVGFQNEVLKVAKNTKKGASEIANAFQIVGSAKPELLSSAEALSAVSEQAVILAKASGMDIPAAAAALTQAMNQFGASAEDASMFVDILATSQQKGTATIQQLSDAMLNVGSVANVVGLTFEETNVAIQALAKGGQIGSEAGNGLKTVLSKLAATSRKDLNPTFTDLGSILNTLANENISVAQANKLVGLEGTKTLLTLVKQRDVVATLNNNLNETGNALEQAETRYDTLTGAQERLTSSWETFLLSLDSGKGVIGGTLKDLNNFFAGVLEGIEIMDEFNARLKEKGFSELGSLSWATKDVNQRMKEMHTIQGEIMAEDFFKKYGTTGVNNMKQVRYWVQKMNMEFKDPTAAEAFVRNLMKMRAQSTSEMRELLKEVAAFVPEIPKTDQGDSAGFGKGGRDKIKEDIQLMDDWEKKMKDLRDVADVVEKSLGDKVNPTIAEMNERVVDLNQNFEVTGEKSDFFIGSLINFWNENKEAILQTADLIGDQLEGLYQKQVELTERRTDLLNEEISQNQEAIKIAQADREAGYANDYDALKERDQRLKEIRQQAFEEEKRAKRNELLANSAIEASNLGIAISKILASTSLAPPVAAALIAAMLGTFAASKVAAFKAVNNSVPKFAKGGHGMLGGKYHFQGGVQIPGIGEAERNEYFGIVNRGATQKYMNILPEIFDSLNSGNFEDKYMDLSSTNGILREIADKDKIIIQNGWMIIKQGNTTKRIKL